MGPSQVHVFIRGGIHGHYVGSRLPHRGTSGRANLHRITDTISSERGDLSVGLATIQPHLLRADIAIFKTASLPMIYNELWKQQFID